MILKSEGIDCLNVFIYGDDVHRAARVGELIGTTDADEIQKAMRNAAAFAGQDQERKAALEAFNAAEAALYRVNTALGSKAGKALDRDTRSKIKDAVRALEKELRHKKADKLTTADVQSLNAAREALSAIATPLVTQWESEK